MWYSGEDDFENSYVIAVTKTNNEPLGDKTNIIK